MRYRGRCRKSCANKMEKLEKLGPKLRKSRTKAGRNRKKEGKIGGKESEIRKELEKSVRLYHFDPAAW